MIDSIDGSLNSISNQNLVLADTLGSNAQQYSNHAFNLVMQIAENIALPVAGIIFTYVVVTDLIQMQMAQNNMHENTTFDLFKWIFKTAIGVVLISNSFTIANAIIELGTELVAQTMPLTNIDAGSVSLTASPEMMQLSIGQLYTLSFGLSVTNIAHILGGFLVNLFIITRFFEIYMYLMVAPIPFSTLTSGQMTQSGLNYIKNVLALALQGLVILVIFAIYTAISANITLNAVVDENIFTGASSLAEGMVLLIALVVMVWRSRSITQSIVGSY